MYYYMSYIKLKEYLSVRDTSNNYCILNRIKASSFWPCQSTSIVFEIHKLFYLGDKNINLDFISDTHSKNFKMVLEKSVAELTQGEEMPLWEVTKPHYYWIMI